MKFCENCTPPTLDTASCRREFYLGLAACSAINSTFDPLRSGHVSTRFVKSRIHRRPRPGTTPFRHVFFRFFPRSAFLASRPGHINPSHTSAVRYCIITRICGRVANARPVVGTGKLGGDIARQTLFGPNSNIQKLTDNTQTGTPAFRRAKSFCVSLTAARLVRSRYEQKNLHCETAVSEKVYTKIHTVPKTSDYFYIDFD